MEKKNNVSYNSPFKVYDRPTSPGIDVGRKDYVDRKVYLEYVETGRDENGKSIGSVEPVIRETYTDIDKLVNSHKNEVGVKNLIMLFSRTGDLSLFNQRRSINSAVGGELDLTKIPQSSASDIYGQIPDDLKGNRNIEDFLKTLTKEQFESFVNTLKDKYSKKVEGDSNE